MMQQRDWRGVFPAITTPFTEQLAVDHRALAAHVEWLAAAGCRGIVALGSLGEGATLEHDEKLAILETCDRTLVGTVSGPGARPGGRLPLVAGIAATSTAAAVRLAREAASIGADGLMVLPPYVHKGDWRELRAHFDAVISATPLSCMLYNNPIAYGADVRPHELAELAGKHQNLHAVKDSSGDVRRVAAVQEGMATAGLGADRLAIFAGLDDQIVESIPMGAVGWIAGLVNALPVESVRLFDLAEGGQQGNGAAWREALALYRWFLPLLRLDTLPKFVQLIKLVQAEVGRGSAWVRPPRMELVGAERDDALALIRRQLSVRPALSVEARARSAYAAPSAAAPSAG